MSFDIESINRAIAELVRVKDAEGRKTCKRHCWHYMAWGSTPPPNLRPGFIVLECCECPEQKRVHNDHAKEYTE